MKNKIEDAIRWTPLVPTAPNGRVCRVSKSGKRMSVEIESLDRNFSALCFTLSEFNGQCLWMAERCSETPGIGDILEAPSMQTLFPRAQLAVAVEPWFTSEFGNVLEAALAGSVLRDLLAWVESEHPRLRWGYNEWPEELGQGIFTAG